MSPEGKMYHNPVLLHEAIEGLAIDPTGKYVDATFGGGGHARAILGELGAQGQLIAFDQDPDAAGNVPDDARLCFLNQNFRYMQNFLRMYGFLPVDGILADLGVSSHQFDQAYRGFSTRFTGPLDMRMNKDSGMTAGEVLNGYEEERLAEVFFLFGELRNAGRIARNIVRQRKTSPVETTNQLMEVLKGLAPNKKENQFFARVFQALRIEVNQELDALRDLLEQSRDSLKTGGRLVVISYHSLEDRLVKNFMRAGNFEGNISKDFFGNPLTPFKPVGKSVAPAADEIAANPRARSARLRIAVKVEEVKV
jgi:16S rRNA (cytosine1402-N4)-methyltransferase